MLAGPPRILPFLTTLLVLATLLYILRAHNNLGRSPPASIPPPSFADLAEETTGAGAAHNVTVDPNAESFTRTLVMAITKQDDIAWLQTELPDEPMVLYEPDNPSPKAPRMRVPLNKGREANVYITYILDHWDSLPDIVLFMHPHRFAWHNSLVFDYDAAQLIKRLNNRRVARFGYMNTRCQYNPGCFDWIHFDRPEADFDDYRKPEERGFNPAVWREVFPDVPVPPALSAPCCAQFAVTRDRIRSRTREQWEYLRNWLYNTNLDEMWSGRFLEYTWHFIFTGRAELCPAANACYCDGYGACFGNDKKLTEWWDIRKQRDDAVIELKRLQGIKDKGLNHPKLRKEIDDILDMLPKWDRDLADKKSEALKRGLDPEIRKKETERVE